MAVIFITGIDTNSGKTIATGLLARYLHKNNKTVITQKLVQTGCEKMSEDILLHRKLMGMELFEDDKNNLTCPYIFKYPASPHLSARLEQKTIDIDIIDEATYKLSRKFETVLLEGAGGIYVPLTDNFTVLDYIETRNYPIILVSSAKLGSINHTLLTLDAIKNRDLDVIGIIFNEFPKQEKEIIRDTRDVFERYISQYWFNAAIIDIPILEGDSIPDINFGKFFYNE
ncbi:MAG: dethiobiotin synthase [Spirochaetota bacterium]